MRSCRTGGPKLNIKRVRDVTKLHIELPCWKSQMPTRIHTAKILLSRTLEVFIILEVAVSEWKVGI